MAYIARKRYTMANYMNNMKSNKANKMMNKVNKGQVTLDQLLELDKAGMKIDMTPDCRGYLLTWEKHMIT